MARPQAPKTLKAYLEGTTMGLRNRERRQRPSQPAAAKGIYETTSKPAGEKGMRRKAFTPPPLGGFRRFPAFGAANGPHVMLHRRQRAQVPVNAAQIVL